MHFAPRVSGKADFTSDGEVFTIASGDPIKIYGIVLANSATGSANVINLTVSNGSTVIKTIALAGRTTLTLTTQFMADGGLSVTLVTVDGAARSDFSVTVFHSNAGA